METVSQRRGQLRREVDRHRTKLDAAERRLEALEALSGDDPFVDGAALRFDVLRRDLGRTLTYVTLRAGGFWYSTGIKGTAGHRTRWADLIDWWIDHEVTEVTLLEPGETISLSEFPSPVAEPVEPFVVHECDNPDDHQPHAWRGVRLGSGDSPRAFWCRGVPKA